MSKDLVRLLKLQEIGASATRPSHGGIDESFGVIGQELDALTSKVIIASDHRDELEKKVALQTDELSSLRQALKESEAMCLKLEDDIRSLQAQLHRGFDPTEESESDSEQGEAWGTPMEVLDPIAVDGFSLSPESGFLENLNIKTVPTEWKQEGTDWFAVFNPNVERVFNITLVNTLNYNSPVRCVRLSPDVKYISVACDTTVHIYDAETGVEMCSFPTKKTVEAICFSQDSSIFAVGTDDEKIEVLTTDTWEIRYTFGGNTTGIGSLCFSPDGKSLMAGSFDNTARIWSLVDGTCKTIEASSGSILSIAPSPNGLVALGCRNGSIEIWNQRKKEPQLVETISAHESAVQSLAYIRPTGKGLLSASEDESLKYWDVSPFLGSNKALANRRTALGGESPIQCMMKFTGHKECVTSLAISHDSKWVVSGSKDHSVQFWDLKTATLRCMLKCHTDFITSVDLSQTGNILVTGSKDGEVRMWAYT